ncbi:MAG: RNA-directed DNA polymerase, partial [Verrucomicrobia bacterium]
MNIERAIDAALRNVARHGDTDIFPFPFENLVFSDRLADAPAVLETIHKDFQRWLSSYPPETIPTLTQVGYTGFRWATLIDPFWNAYYLALVVSIAEQIEAQRIPQSDGVVFSYRFN